jgi:hypothetical protein
LFSKDPRDYRIGRDVLPAKRNVSRYVKWPRYVRIQRQKVLKLEHAFILGAHVRACDDAGVERLEARRA